MKKTKKTKNSLKGFTLMELMITISIFIIMVAAAAISFIPIKKNMALKSAQSEVASAIKLAQSYALQGRMPSGETTGVCGYGFKFINNNKYQIFYYKEESGSCDPSNSHNQVETKTFTNNIILSSPSSANTSITFDIPNGNTNLSSPVDFTFMINGVTDMSKSITIGPNGLVSEN